ncbi:hypothetical protein [Streptomyces parvus]|uniref:hypothetical protein n=1 Tax=Streptomyces parvus TaxID=66428 RepID=UPI003326C921
MSRKTATKTRTRTPKTKTTPAVLPVRPLHPDFITQNQINAAYAARLAGLPTTPIRAWTPNPDGTVHLAFPSGNRIHHTPAGFTAITPCATGYTHQTPIADRDQLNTAVHTAAQCTSLHGRPRVLTVAQAAATAEDTQTLDVTDLRADHDQAHPHPTETTPGYDIALAAAEAHGHAAARHQETNQ